MNISVNHVISSITLNKLTMLSVSVVVIICTLGLPHGAICNGRPTSVCTACQITLCSVWNLTNFCALADKIVQWRIPYPSPSLLIANLIAVMEPSRYKSWIWGPTTNISLSNNIKTHLLIISSINSLSWCCGPLSPPLHTPYISSPNHCLHFTTHTQTKFNLFCCSTRIMSSNPSLSLSTLYLELHLLLKRHTSIWPLSSLPTEVPLHFLYL